MSNETHDTSAALSDGAEVIFDKASVEALSIGGVEDGSAAAASGDRDAAVDLLLYEIRGLKSERSGLQVALSDTQAKLASAESELREVGSRASRLEEQLHIAQEDISVAKLAAMKHRDEVLQLNASIENMQAMQVKVDDLNSTIKFLEEELKAYKQKEVDKDDKFCKRESELSAIIQELRSELATEKEKNLSIISEKDSKMPLMQSQALGAAAIVGVAALAAGAVVYLRLFK